MKPDGFIDIPFDDANLARYTVRTSIKKALTECMPHLQGKLLDIGCGKMPYKDFILNNSKVDNYVGLDIETAREYDMIIKPDFTWDGIKMPFQDATFDSAFGTEVLEHCPEPEVILSEIYRVLKPGGSFFFTVPFLWNLHETPHDEYRYTPFALKRHFSNAGFTEINIKATGGWHASMAQMLGIWVVRSPMNDKKRKIIQKLVKPIIKKLLKMEGDTIVDFKEGQMITGLYGVIKK